MKGKRLFNQIRFILINSPYKRADFIRKHKVFHSIGDAVSFMPRKLPLYGELIEIGNNVVIASDVSFLTHDAFYKVNNRASYEHVNEKVGCIRIGNNCFIGANSQILYDVSIGDDCVIASGATVVKDVPPGEIWGGVSAKFLGKTSDLRKKYRENLKVHIKNEKIQEENVCALWNAFNDKRNL